MNQGRAPMNELPDEPEEREAVVKILLKHGFLTDEQADALRSKK